MSLFEITCHKCGTVTSADGDDIFYMTHYKCPKCLTPMSTWAFTEMKYKELSLALAARHELSKIKPIYDANLITWRLDALPGEVELQTYLRVIAESLAEEEKTDENGRKRTKTDDIRG